MSDISRSPLTLLVDAHAHLHSSFDIDRFLEAAAQNLETAAAELGVPWPAVGVLCLMDVRGQRSLLALRDGFAGGKGSAWSGLATAEGGLSLVLRRTDGLELVLVAGRQLVTAEDLEILALGCDAELSDGLEFAETLAAVRQIDALPIVAWGLGKWSFRRGRLVSSALEGLAPGSLFLGDTPHRPRAAPRPRLFRRAEELGLHVLPGSDPFPFPHQIHTVGRFGFLLPATLDPARPATGLKAALRRADTPFLRFGATDSIAGFVRDQIAIQLVKRRRQEEPA